MKEIRKIIAIGVIALFIGLATTPTITGSSVVKVEKTLVEKFIRRI